MKTEREKQLENALVTIANYGNDGICPYGCDCPNIAHEVLFRERLPKGNENRGESPQSLSRLGDRLREK